MFPLRTNKWDGWLFNLNLKGGVVHLAKSYTFWHQIHEWGRVLQDKSWWWILSSIVCPPRRPGAAGSCGGSHGLPAGGVVSWPAEHRHAWQWRGSAEEVGALQLWWWTGVEQDSAGGPLSTFWQWCINYPKTRDSESFQHFTTNPESDSVHHD